MNTDIRQTTIKKIYRRYRQHQVSSILWFARLLILLVSLLWLLFSVKAQLAYGGDGEALGGEIFVVVAYGGVVSFVSFILMSLFKHATMLANFWYSRALALELYDGESEIPLKDLVASLASEAVKFSLPTKSLADMVATWQGKDAQ